MLLWLRQQYVQVFLRCMYSQNMAIRTTERTALFFWKAQCVHVSGVMFLLEHDTRILHVA